MQLLFITVVLAADSPAAKLFDEGRDALKAGRTAQACRLFSESHQLDPALGTLLNLAVCLETEGKSASAFLRFNEAEAWATRTRERQRAEFAAAKARGLKAKLAWVALRAPVRVAGQHATVGGQAVAQETELVSVPVDPGVVRIEVTAPQRLGWKTEVASPPPGTTLDVEVPALAPEQVALVAERHVEQPPARSSPSVALRSDVDAPRAAHPEAVVGLVLSGLLVTASAITLSWSLTVAEQVRLQQVTGLLTTTRRQFDTAVAMYPFSIAGLLVGVAAGSVSAVLLFKKNASPVVAPLVGPGAVGVALSGAWGSP